MKILQVNKFHYPQGGADTYFLDLCRMLEAKGHSVARFSMQNPKNLPSAWDRFFVSQVDYNEGSFANRLKGAGRIFYSREARRKFDALLGEFHPDIIHIHNIYHQISPSILLSSRKAGIPVVMHLHDYKLLSPNYTLFSGRRLYDRCIGGNYWRCVPDRCFKGSAIKSALVAAEMYLHHDILRVYEENVDIFAAPSQFLADMVMKHRPELASKVRVIPNPVDDRRFVPAPEGKRDYFLAYGRLAYEKGFDIVIQAFAALKPAGMRLMIVGDGPERKNLEDLVKGLGLTGSVDMPGALVGDDLTHVIQNAYAVVVPSRWFEVFGLTNIEAMACGRPVIASAIGAIPDIVRDGENGLLFLPENFPDLAEKMAAILKNPEKADFLGRNGRNDAECRFSNRIHTSRIEALYREATILHSKRG